MYTRQKASADHWQTSSAESNAPTAKAGAVLKTRASMYASHCTRREIYETDANRALSALSNARDACLPDARRSPPISNGEEDGSSRNSLRHRRQEPYRGRRASVFLRRWLQDQFAAPASAPRKTLGAAPRNPATAAALKKVARA